MNGTAKTPADGLYQQAHAALAAASDRFGFAIRDARLTRLHSNAVFLLPSAGLVVRMATDPGALARVTQSVRVTRWLASRGFPCTIPADITGQPLPVHGLVLAIWQYVTTTVSQAPMDAELGALLRVLHKEPLPADRPAELTDPLGDLTAAIATAPAALQRADRVWLTGQIARLRDTWQALEFPHPPCLIHGDAHPGNLMRNQAGQVIIGDWDNVATGPREWDLAQIHYLQRRFGYQPDIRRFTTAYGQDPRQWPGLPALLAIREITGLSSYLRTAAAKPFARRELANRIACLRRGDTTARWNLPPDESRSPTGHSHPLANSHLQTAAR